MGASCSQAAYTVQVRLERPEVRCPDAFFACLHSAADGDVRYNVWGEPQTLGLLLDDIITVSIFTAQSEQHFDRLAHEEFAEVYLPWDVISNQLIDGQETVFLLGLQPGIPWLGQHALPAQYSSAFFDACGWAQERPSAPRICVGIRRLPQGLHAGKGPEAAPMLPHMGKLYSDSPNSASSAAAVSPAVACGVEELSPDEMKRLFQLQVRNKELRAQLRLREGDGPDVEGQVREHLELLRRAVAENYSLRTGLQSADRELAELSVCLSQEQRLAIADAAGDALPSARSPTAEDSAEFERQATLILGEIQAVTNSNIELIAHYDTQIKTLEAELVRAREAQALAGADDTAGEARLMEAKQELEHSIGELEILEDECAKLEGALCEEPGGNGEADKMEAQKLQLEHEVQEKEIGHLRQILERQYTEEPTALPGSGILQDQVASLQAELSQEALRGEEELASAQQQADELRQHVLAFQDELEAVAEAKLAAEQELEELRARSPDRAPSVQQQHADEEARSESLRKELNRSHCRIEFFDEKIQQLQQEAADIGQRASDVLQVAQVGPGGTPEDAAHIAELEMLVQRQQQEVELMRCREERLRQEQSEAQQAWEDASAYSAMAKKNMTLLHND